MSAYACPNCGETDAWKADYYEAVGQSITLYVGDNGEPEFGDYTGVMTDYSDSRTEDEAWRCGSCDYTIEHAQFVMVPKAGYVLVIPSKQELSALRAALKRRIAALENEFSGRSDLVEKATRPYRSVLERAEQLDSGGS